MIPLNSLFVKLAVVLATLSANIENVAAQKAGSMQVGGNSGVSGQMMFLQSNGQVAILDKMENNPIQKPNGKGPAAAAFFNYNTNGVQADNLETNPFCAGGATLGDGRWIVVGGNRAVTTGGLDGGQGKSPYYNRNGGKSLRFLSPCSGSSCKWTDNNAGGLQRERWYATVEPMADGSVMMLGGMRNGGYVPSAGSNEATYEYYPSKGDPVDLDILKRTVPLSLYPLTYLLADNRVFIQAGKSATIWNQKTRSETKLPKIHGPPRVYPASGGTAMLPMLPSNNYSQTILFCGGQTLGARKGWGNEAGPATMVTEKPASTSCTQITPLTSQEWEDVDPLPEARTMGQFIHLPDGTMWFGNGATTGTAGYTSDPNSPGKPVGKSFADNPSYKPLIYNPRKPSGQRWRQVGYATVPRLYHSSATLLPDSSILIAGSNPSPDVTTKQKWNTEYRTERWYPPFYDEERPSNAGVPNAIGYGGSGFTLKMNSAAEAQKTTVMIIRTGFSSHGLNMGQRSLQLRSAAKDNLVNVAAMPANPALFPPGPALAFVVVNGVPSMGKFIVVGNGQIGTQSVSAETDLRMAQSSQTMVKARRGESGISGVLSELQKSSLSGEDMTRATGIAQALSGEPVAGKVLPMNVGNTEGSKEAPGSESLLGSVLDPILQGSVNEVEKKLADGSMHEKLSG